MNIVLKPNFAAFFLYPAVKITLVFGVIFGFVALLIGLFTGIQSIGFVIIIFLGILLLIFIDLYIKFRKESYELTSEAIIKLSGSIFSDTRTEIAFDKIIAYTEVYPFIKTNLFNTKDIFIESAGTQFSTISLNSLNIEEVNSILISKLDDLLGLKDDVVLNELRPSIRGILIDIAKSLTEIAYTMGIYILFYGGSQIIFKNGNIIGNILLIFGIYLAFWFLGIIFRLARVLITIFTTQYDFNRNSILITSGFLSKTKVYIPNSALTDVKIYQEFWEKTFFLKNFVLSIKNNPSFAVLFYFPKNFELNVNSILKERNRNIQNEVQDYINLKPNVLRYVIDIFIEVLVIALMLVFAYFYPPLFILLVPGVSFIYYVFVQASEVFFTKYFIEGQTVHREYSFISSKYQKINLENITSIKITQNWFDKLLNTCSVIFFSLGASESIKFSYIDYDESLIKKIETLFNYEKIVENSVYLKSEINLENFISSNFLDFTKAIGIALVISSIAFFYLPKILFFIYILILLIFAVSITLNQYFGYKNSFFNIWKDFSYQEYGWWLRIKKITKNEFIKAINILDYPGTKYGEISFNLAGDIYGQNTQSLIDTALSGTDENITVIKYLTNPIEKLEPLKLSIFDKEDSDKVYTDFFKPDFLNSFLRLLPLCIFPPLILVIIYSFFKTKFTSFEIYNTKLVKKSGIFYKSREEISISNIDYIETKKDFTNKLVGNYKIEVYTSGKSQTDMVINDINSDLSFLRIKKSI